MKMFMSHAEEERQAHWYSHSCAMCGCFFGGDVLKVRDHFHISGHYRFALCSLCNLTRAKRQFKVPVFFHGLCNYNSHFIVWQLVNHPVQRIHVVPRNSEKYLAFTYRSLHFKDSYQFLGECLTTLMQNLKTKGIDRFRYLNRFIQNEEERELMSSKGVLP